ncbi:MAG: coenzyme F420-0:L-glutamate ligase [Candidatus Nitrosopumilus limneticus]|nr:Coenzyme F420:L-glutamate ligase [Candidatus Nitrosopumilus limneticus]MDC4212669.1 coenzyme F420-0:L-glutamate ligase [Candidatus Nitrosopumilus limneticus]MDC4213427.1 coenzyme F420-0:L-glutamate ligase [Candidatus Nitrosopumilus limneticus]MDC4214297.1 coenzyme F420-0:L-glutamate ligase [Candidatus Nitrosopumilus limneticus]MDC4215460.1 coenzyme F420-0:L-glutamate ligase [Candidatus Nitrosopumilus limneticus]
MQILPIHIEKEITENDDLSTLIINSCDIHNGDVVVIAQKIISKQEGRVVKLSTITPSLLSEGISSQYNKDPRIVELILSESKKIVRMKNGLLIVETNHGFICANAGIDESNVVDGFVTLLPLNSDRSAELIRTKILNKTGKNVAIIISDTFGRPFRMGQINCAIGISGLNPILDYSGTLDSFNRILRVTAIAIADELSSAAELVMEKTKKCPVVIIRNYSYDFTEKSIDDLIRPENEDLFK